MKSKTTMWILFLTLGTLGVHSWYVGDRKTAIVKLFTLNYLGFGLIKDFIGMLLMSANDFEARYNSGLVQKEMLKALKK